MTTEGDRASIIIPAHNEAQVIARCLRSLCGDRVPDGWQVVVVCNGCTDDSARAARAAIEGVEVEELDVASKIAALNAGDRRALHFPRVYLDADIEMRRRDLELLLTHMRATRAPVASLMPTFDYSRSSYGVKLFYEIWKRTAYFKYGIIGSGLYALSEEGRARFEDFPDITADDGFVRSRFTAAERSVAPAGTFTLRCPTGISGVIKVKTRARFGALELRRRGLAGCEERGRGRHLGTLLRTLRDVRLWPGLPIYAYVKIVCEAKARWRLATRARRHWDRDDSSRALQGQ